VQQFHAERSNSHDEEYLKNLPSVMSDEEIKAQTARQLKLQIAYKYKIKLYKKYLYKCTCVRMCMCVLCTMLRVFDSKMYIHKHTFVHKRIKQIYIQSHFAQMIIPSI